MGVIKSGKRIMKKAQKANSAAAKATGVKKVANIVKKSMAVPEQKHLALKLLGLKM